MAQDPKLYRIPVKGGVLPPAEMLRHLDLARELGLDGLHFGSRQDILLPVQDPSLLHAPRHAEMALEPIDTGRAANIISSYVTADIFPKTSWLTSATYLYILEQFLFSPRLEVNITDPRQRMVPLFTGHLNFIASPEEDFWYLYLQLPGWKQMETFPALLHSWDLAKVVMALDPHADELPDLAACVVKVNDKQQLNTKNIAEDLTIPFHPFPYYEGMNRLDNRQYWLGLYWRNNWYSLDFLQATCELCMEHRIGKICITPWKSFIITGIPEEKRLEWEKLLGRFGINARHSSLELNWHLPIGNQEALMLKRYLVREFDRRDISTYGLTIGFSVAYSRPFTSIVVEKESGPDFVNGFAVPPTYNLKYARSFDPNTREYVEYARRVDRADLVELIMELSRLYFEQLNEDQGAVINATPPPVTEKQEREYYQCEHCQSIYDSSVGEPENGIPAGTHFVDLPADYACWTCGAEKGAFRAVVLDVGAVAGAGKN
ncbi:MAG: rubredoxin domain-containing protein [Bacteroidota bacterium]